MDQDAVAQGGEQRNVLRKKNAGLPPDDLETGEVEQVLDIEGAEPVLDRLSRLRSESFTQAQDRLPEEVEVREDDARPRCADCPQPLEAALDVVKEPQQVGDHDIIECFPDAETFQVIDAELEMRVLLRREPHHAGTEIDSDAP